MSYKWPIFRPPSLLSNSVHRKSLSLFIGVLLIAFFSVAQASNSARLVNISSRCIVKSGVGNTIAGFIIEGGSKTIMIRGLGRGLGLSPNLDVEMDVSKYPSGEFVARNDNWQTDIMAAEIPSHLQLPDATDAGLLLTLPAGAYTAVVKPKGASGIGLVSVDDLDDPQSASRLINISTRCSVEKSDKNAIAGFIIKGTGTQRVMIGALGKGLGLSLNLDTQMALSKYPSGELMESNESWQRHRNASQIPTHLQLPDPSDAGLLLDLPAGAYTAVVKPTGEIGIGLVAVNAISSGSPPPSTPKYSSTPASGSTLNFASTPVGTPVSYDLIISEAGNADLVLNSSSISGTNANDFRVLTAFPLTLPDNAVYIQAPTVTLQCTPSGENLRTASLQISSNEGTHSYPLQCTGNKELVAPPPPPSPPESYSLPNPGDTLNFGSTPIGTPVAQNILTIGNKGNGDLIVNFVTISGINADDFKMISPNFPLTVASGVYQPITMQCNPTVKGLREATLQLSTNDPNQSFITYPLKCEGETITNCFPDFTPTERNDDIIGSLGFGYDNQRDIFKPQTCLKGSSTEVGAGWSNLDFTSISKYEELKRHLGIEVNFNVKATFFKMKAETKFALDHRETILSRSLLFKVDVRLANGQFNQKGLSEFGQDMHNKGNQCFRNACGDQFLFQTERGGSLYMAMKFDFNNAERKKEFFAKMTGEYKVVDMSAEIQKTSSLVKENGKVTVSAYQLGGDVTKLANIFGTDSGLSPFLTCKLTEFEKCQQAMQNAINYAKGDFANSINSKPHLLGYQGVSYKDMGVPIEWVPVSPEIIEARKELAYEFEKQYSDLLLTRSWLDDFANDLKPDEKQYLRDIEQALDINIELLTHAGMWCFSDLTLCLDKKREAFENLHYYNKEWLDGIQFIPPVIKEYSDQRHFQINLYVDNGWNEKCASQDGRICLPDNCQVDFDQTQTNSLGPLGNSGGPGYGINVAYIFRGRSASNTITGKCLSSVVTACSEKRYGNHGKYIATHTIYGKCTKIEEEDKFKVPSIP